MRISTSEKIGCLALLVAGLLLTAWVVSSFSYRAPAPPLSNDEMVRQERRRCLENLKEAGSVPKEMQRYQDDARSKC